MGTSWMLIMPGWNLKYCPYDGHCTGYEMKSPNLREATDVPSGLRNDSVPSSSFSTIHPSGTLDSASIFFHNICNFVQGLKVTGLLFCIPSNKNTFTFTSWQWKHDRWHDRSRSDQQRLRSENYCQSLEVSMDFALEQFSNLIQNNIIVFKSSEITTKKAGYLKKSELNK